MAIYVYTGTPGEEWQPLIPGDYTLLRWPCDEGFHVPLEEERQAILDTGISSSNIKSKLYIPVAWYIWKNGWSWESWTKVYLHTSTISASVYTKTFYTDNSTWKTISEQQRAYGYWIRAFRNTPIIPDENWTETLSGIVWYNESLWLISVLVGTNQYVTLQDKNVWATEVCTNRSTITANNRWKYFQRWNNYGFTWDNISPTSETKVDPTWYWPSNPYSSNTFILCDVDSGSRCNPQNDNLRWYTDFNS